MVLSIPTCLIEDFKELLIFLMPGQAVSSAVNQNITIPETEYNPIRLGSLGIEYESASTVAPLSAPPGEKNPYYARDRPKGLRRRHLLDG